MDKVLLPVLKYAFKIVRILFICTLVIVGIPVFFIGTHILAAVSFMFTKQARTKIFETLRELWHSDIYVIWFSDFIHGIKQNWKD